VTGVQTCALPISFAAWRPSSPSSTSGSPVRASARASSRIRKPGGVVGTGRSPVGSEVAQPVAELLEGAAVALAAAGGLVAAQGGELLEQLALLVAQRSGHVHVEDDPDVAAALAAQRRGPEPLEGDLLAGLGAGPPVEVLVPVEGLQRDGGAEGGGGDGHGDGGDEVVAVAGEDVVVGDAQLDEQVAGGTAGLADLPLAAQLDPGAVLDAGGDPHGHGALGRGAAVAGAARAGAL